MQVDGSVICDVTHLSDHEGLVLVVLLEEARLEDAVEMSPRSLSRLVRLAGK